MRKAAHGTFARGHRLPAPTPERQPLLGAWLPLMRSKVHARGRTEFSTSVIGALTPRHHETPRLPAARRRTRDHGACYGKRGSPPQGSSLGGTSAPRHVHITASKLRNASSRAAQISRPPAPTTCFQSHWRISGADENHAVPRPPDATAFDMTSTAIPSCEGEALRSESTASTKCEHFEGLRRIWVKPPVVGPPKTDSDDR